MLGEGNVGGRDTEDNHWIHFHMGVGVGLPVARQVIGVERNQAVFLLLGIDIFDKSPLQQVVPDHLLRVGILDILVGNAQLVVAVNYQQWAADTARVAVYNYIVERIVIAHVHRMADARLASQLPYFEDEVLRSRMATGQIAVEVDFAPPLFEFLERLDVQIT